MHEPQCSGGGHVQLAQTQCTFSHCSDIFSGSSDVFVSEDSYEMNANACFWYNQDNRLHDSVNCNACFAGQVPLISD